MPLRSRSLLVAVALFGVLTAVAAPRSSVADSADLVRRWLGRGGRIVPPREFRVREVVGHRVPGAAAEFHEVRFAQGGFAVVDTSDPAGGVLAFSASGTLAEDEENPLWALLARHAARRQAAGAASAPIASDGELDDLRVAPLVESRWYQGSAGGGYCCNYHTPNHWLCGCVATAMAQILRYYRYPQAAVAPHTNECAVGSVVTNLAMIGGSYDWEKMPAVVTGTVPEDEREAIGHLTYDCGVAVHMRYTANGSGAFGAFAFDPLRQVFGYASASYYPLEVVPDQLEREDVRNAILASLDARAPVMLAINSADGKNGHEVVVDGYGTAEGVFYAHLNMGWAGQDDAWYALPEIGTRYDFTVADGVIYNIFPERTGAVVSGRVCGHGGKLANVAVLAYGPGGELAEETVSDENGVYAFVLSENTAYTLVASNDLAVVTNAVRTGADAPIIIAEWSEGTYYPPLGGFSCGNRWGNDFEMSGGRDLYVDAENGSDATGSGDEESPYASITNALARAGAQDAVRVAPGRYRGRVTAPVRAVSVVSTGGPEVTVIDADGDDCCYDGSSNPNSVLRGFTLVNGYGRGGAVSATLEDCIISNCTGGASYSADYGGGASRSTLTGCVLCGNIAPYGGGALDCSLTHCTVFGNCATDSGCGGGLDCDSTAVDSIVWDNFNLTDGTLSNWESFLYYGKTYVTRFGSSCTFPEGFGDLGGSFTNDPEFVSLATDDWRLREGSPCLDAASDGLNVGVWQGEGVSGHAISVRIVGSGTVTPAFALVPDGASQTFTAGGRHPFLRFATNDVDVTTEPEFTWADVRSDGTLTAYFDTLELQVDAANAGDPAADGTPEHPFAEIQPAVDAAGDGDSIVVAPGRYGPVVNSRLLDVTIRSTDGASATMVDAKLLDRCVTDYGRLEWTGFAFVNGFVMQDAGGLGGGDYHACVVSNCQAAAGGGAVSAFLDSCLIVGNSAAEYGGGAYDCYLVNCTVTGNTSEYHAGGLCLDRSGAAFNCIFAGNVSSSGYTYGHDLYDAGARTVKCFTGGDPRFVDAASGDYRLASDSPCLDAGYDAFVTADSDLDGAPRRAGAAVDLGCHEAARPVAFATDGLCAGANGCEETVKVCAEGDWELTSDADWLRPCASSGTGPAEVTVRIAPNATGARREGSLTLADGANADAFAVTQVGGVKRGGRHYGLFVGVDRYSWRFPGGSTTLSGCVAAAEALQALCLRSGLWHPGTVTTLADGAATKAAIRSRLAALAEAAEPGDVFLYVQVGRGEAAAYDPCNNAFCAYDAYYTDEELAADLHLFKAGVRIIVVADTDHAGGMFRPPSGHAAYYDASGDIAFLSASDFDQLVFGRSFGEAVGAGWSGGGADQDGDGRVDFGELFAFAVPRATFAPETSWLDLAEPRCFNAPLLLETLAEVTDPKWPEPAEGEVAAALREAGYADAIVAAVTTPAQYGEFAKWIETAGVTPAEANASGTAVLSAAVWADGLLDPRRPGLTITGFAPSGADGWRLSATVAGMDARQLNAELVKAAVAVKTAVTLEGLPSATPVSPVVTPLSEGLCIEFGTDAAPSRFFQLVPR